MHIHALTCTYMHKHDIHALTCPHTCTCLLSTYILSLTCTHMHIHAHTCTYMHTHAFTNLQCPHRRSLFYEPCIGFQCRYHCWLLCLKAHVINTCRGLFVSWELCRDASHDVLVLCVRLARTVYIHHIWPYIWWFPCQKYRVYTVYIWFWPTLIMCRATFYTCFIVLYVFKLGHPWHQC